MIEDLTGDLLKALLVTLGVALFAVGWYRVYLWWWNSSSIWGGMESQDLWPRIPPEIPRPLERPRIFKNMGTHVNPLALEPSEAHCDGWFEQLDTRTWECEKCHLLHFEKAEISS